MAKSEKVKIYIQKILSEHLLSRDQKNLLERYLFVPLPYVSGDNFQNFDRMKTIIDHNINVISGELLTPDHERILFQQMN